MREYRYLYHALVGGAGGEKWFAVNGKKTDKEVADVVVKALGSRKFVDVAEGGFVFRHRGFYERGKVTGFFVEVFKDSRLILEVIPYLECLTVTQVQMTPVSPDPYDAFRILLQKYPKGGHNHHFENILEHLRSFLEPLQRTEGGSGPVQVWRNLLFPSNDEERTWPISDSSKMKYQAKVVYNVFLPLLNRTPPLTVSLAEVSVSLEGTTLFLSIGKVECVFISIHVIQRCVLVHNVYYYQDRVNCPPEFTFDDLRSTFQELCKALKIPLLVVPDNGHQLRVGREKVSSDLFYLATETTTYYQKRYGMMMVPLRDMFGLNDSYVDFIRGDLLVKTGKLPSEEQQADFNAEVLRRWDEVVHFNEVVREKLTKLVNRPSAELKGMSVKAHFTNLKGTFLATGQGVDSLANFPDEVPENEIKRFYYRLCDTRDTFEAEDPYRIFMMVFAYFRLRGRVYMKNFDNPENVKSVVNVDSETVAGPIDSPEVVSTDDIFQGFGPVESGDFVEPLYPRYWDEEEDDPGVPGDVGVLKEEDEGPDLLFLKNLLNDDSPFHPYYFPEELGSETAARPAPTKRRISVRESEPFDELQFFQLPTGEDGDESTEEEGSKKIRRVGPGDSHPPPDDMDTTD